MPKRVPPEIDRKIIIDLGLGKSNKEVARTYGVSASYVSKVKTGKKEFYIPTTHPPMPEKVDTEVYLEKEILLLKTRLHVFEELLKMYKGEI